MRMRAMREWVRVLLCVLLLAVAGALPPGGAVAQEAELYCSHCQMELPGDALYCPYCGRPVDCRASIYCWRCGSLLPADASYCTQCGSEVCSDHQRAAGRRTARLSIPPAPPLAALPAPEGAAPVPAPPVVAPPIATPPAPPAAAPAAPAPPAEPEAIVAAEPAAASVASAESVTEPASTETPAETVSPALEVKPSAAAKLRAALRERMIVQPPRVISSPTGTILPSLVLHLSGGWAFGFSEDDHSGDWLLSFGLGGVGEVMITSSRILHVLEARSSALAGFRARMPVGLLSGELAEHLAIALNVAATGENEYDAGAFEAADGGSIQGLAYEHRETTLGLAGTWTHGALRLHAALHGTDLRTTNIYYAPGFVQSQRIDDQRDTYTTIGCGADYAVDERTRVLAELRTVPRVLFYSADEDLRTETLTEYAAGLRFYPLPLIGLDATLTIDEEAVGLADLEIGFGVHITVGPREALLAPAEEER